MWAAECLMIWLNKKVWCTWTYRRVIKWVFKSFRILKRLQELSGYFWMLPLTFSVSHCAINLSCITSVLVFCLFLNLHLHSNLLNFLQVKVFYSPISKILEPSKKRLDNYIIVMTLSRDLHFLQSVSYQRNSWKVHWAEITQSVKKWLLVTLRTLLI